MGLASVQLGNTNAHAPGEKKEKSTPSATAGNAEDSG